MNIIYTTLLSNIYFNYIFEKSFFNLNLNFVIKYKYLIIIQFRIKYMLSLYLTQIKYNKINNKSNKKKLFVIT